MAATYGGCFVSGGEGSFVASRNTTACQQASAANNGREIGAPAAAREILIVRWPTLKCWRGDEHGGKHLLKRYMRDGEKMKANEKLVREIAGIPSCQSGWSLGSQERREANANQAS